MADYHDLSKFDFGSIVGFREMAHCFEVKRKFRFRVYLEHTEIEKVNQNSEGCAD